MGGVPGDGGKRSLGSNTKPGEPKATKIEDKSTKNEKVTEKMHLGKHSNFNDFSDGQKTGEIRQKSSPGVKKARIFMIFHAFCRPKTMQKHDPPKPLKLKEASSDMLAAPFPSFSFGHQFSLKLNVFSITAPGPHFSTFFWDL